MVPAAGQTATPNAIDWRDEMETAAVRQLATEGQKREQDAALDPPHVPQYLAPQPLRPQFGWDYAATHRVQSLPEGGVLINVNDRCTIVIFLIATFGCSLDRPPPQRGDLFQHMHDPPLPGRPEPP